ncbi:MAG: diaminopimelate epimerase [Geminicoccaceae bacterium]|nr:diaminopimelate epimerase [Geminicoccaceae bacterium]
MSRALPFTKMHGLGNDFVVIDAREQTLDLSPEAIQRLADRRRGVGFDQLVAIAPSERADARLLFFNADGSEAGACGNGTRCASWLLMLEGDREELVLETRAGTLKARRRPAGLVSVEMGAPRLDWREVPLAVACDTVEVPLDHPELPRPACASMGNPHATFFVRDVETLDVARLGAELERHPIFPERANIGFATRLDRATLRLRVFERGAGLTPACGSGACAAMVAARRRGLVGDVATILLDGGPLEIAWDGEGPVVMTGPAAFVFEGRLAAELLAR